MFVTSVQAVESILVRLKAQSFENSTIPLSKWFMAIFIMTTHRKGISSVQVGRDIGVTQSTAWFMMQRVRNAFKMQSFTYDKIGESIAKDKDGKDIPGIVEADETYIGGKRRQYAQAQARTN